MLTHALSHRLQRETGIIIINKKKKDKRGQKVGKEMRDRKEHADGVNLYVTIPQWQIMTNLAKPLWLNDSDVRYITLCRSSNSVFKVLLCLKAGIKSLRSQVRELETGGPVVAVIINISSFSPVVYSGSSGMGKSCFLCCSRRRLLSSSSCWAALVTGSNWWSLSNFLHRHRGEQQMWPRV